jgi:NADH dehydrogenase
MAWLFVHILFLIGFRNRLMVMIQWAWSYITYERGARLITGDNNLPGWHDRALAPSSAGTQVHPETPEASLRTGT